MQRLYTQLLPLINLLYYTVAFFLVFVAAQHQDAVESAFNTSVRYGAHTDYQGFTILRPDKNDWHYIDVPSSESNTSDSAASPAATVSVLAGGLEVFHRGTQQWMPVKIPKHLNALVINAGKHGRVMSWS